VGLALVAVFEVFAPPLIPGFSPPVLVTPLSTMLLSSPPLVFPVGRPDDGRFDKVFFPSKETLPVLLLDPASPVLARVRRKS